MQLAGDALAGAPLAGSGSGGGNSTNFSGEVLELNARAVLAELASRVRADRVPARADLLEVLE
jgi:hypothetical protein